MLSHERIWAAIDSVARRYNMTTSGLARRAGLDPTTFNKSKRITQEGKRMLARLDGVLPDMIEENFEEPGEFLDEAEDLAA